MFPVSTRIHGLFDYLISAFLIGSPFIFDYSTDGTETWVSVFAGLVLLVYSACTHYESGPLKIFYMRTHLVMDVILGAFLAVSPLIFRFYETVFAPHLWTGLFIIGFALVSSRRPYSRRNPRGDMTKYFSHIPKQS